MKNIYLEDNPPWYWNDPSVFEAGATGTEHGWGFGNGRGDEAGTLLGRGTCSCFYTEYLLTIAGRYLSKPEL